MRGYELMYILDPTMDEDGTKSLIGQIEDFMTKQGVTIENTDPWGKRRLAYKIGRHWEGYYVLSQLQAGAQSVAELERRLRVTDGVLRFLTVRVDKEQAKIGRRRARLAVLQQARRERRGLNAPSAQPDEGPEASQDSVNAEPEAASQAESPAETKETEAANQGQPGPTEEAS